MKIHFTIISIFFHRIKLIWFTNVFNRNQVLSQTELFTSTVPLCSYLVMFHRHIKFNVKV